MQPKSLNVIVHGDVVHIIYAQGEEIQSSETIIPRQTSMLLTATIDTILTRHAITLQQINYISCSRGPGSFTTIRSLIVTVNGLSAVNKIPLIGLTGADEPLISVSKAYALFTTATHHEYALLPLYTPASKTDRMNE